MHILHLEDESPLREILRVALIAAVPDVNLRQFADSDEAMAYVQEHRDEIDLYILDIRVPGSMNGDDFARKLREMDIDSVIALTSAYRAPQRDVLQELDLKWFAKPWHIMELLENLLPMIRTKGK